MSRLSPVDPVDYVAPTVRVHIREPALGVYCSVVDGRVTVGAVGAIIAFAEAMLSSGRRLLVFHDWEKVAGYDPGARKMLTEWSERIKPHWDGSHILFDSPIIAMAVSVAGLTMRGKLTSYSSRASFERALATACASRGVVTLEQQR